MKNNIKIAILIISTLIGLGLDCKKKTVEPDDKPKLGKRNYVWSIDTIAYPNSDQTAMADMWASDAKNVYVVGWNERVFGSMYHYDGTQWKNVKLHYDEGGSIQHGFSFYGIHGTSPSNIWAVGRGAYWDVINQRMYDTSFAIHYDGTQWREFHIIDTRELLSVWVISEGDVWMCGDGGAMYHIIGNQLTKYDMHGDYFMPSICALSSTEVYAIAHRNDKVPPDDSSASFLFRFDGNMWKAIDSVMRTPGSPEPKFGYGGLWTDGKDIYSLSPHVYKKNGQQWKIITEGNISGHMWKSGDNNIFIVGSRVFHFNGNDWFEYTQFYLTPQIGWFDCYADGKEVFVVGNDNWRTFILHGK